MARKLVQYFKLKFAQHLMAWNVLIMINSTFLLLHVALFLCYVCKITLMKKVSTVLVWPAIQALGSNPLILIKLFCRVI